MNKIVTKEKNINYENCIKVVSSLHEYFKDKSDVANIEFPANIKPLSNEYFLYTFYSCLLNYGMRSKIYNQNLINAYNNCPKLFKPDYVITLDEKELKALLVNYVHPRYPSVGTKKWYRLSEELKNYNNLVGYLQNIKSIKELNNFIKDIKGYGQKTGNLLIRMINESKICDFDSDIENIPIDRHDIEISYLTNITNKPKLTENEIKDLSKSYVQASEYLNISPSNVDKYLWEVGASFCNSKKCYTCLINNYCKKGQNNNKEV